MAKKMQLPPEVEDALRKANIPEEKIAEIKEKETQPDVEKLSPDNLEGVSGGLNVSEVSEEDFFNMAMAVTDAFDLDFAVTFMADYYDLDKFVLRNLESQYRGNGRAFWIDVVLMIYHGKTLYA